MSPPSGRRKQTNETGFPFHEKVLQPRLASLPRPSGKSCAAGAWFARNQARSSLGLRDWASKLDSCLASDEITSSAAPCQLVRCGGRVLCQIKLASIALKITAAAIAHLWKRFFQRGTR